MSKPLTPNPSPPHPALSLWEREEEVCWLWGEGRGSLLVVGRGENRGVYESFRRAITTNGLRNNQKNDKNLEQTCLALKYPLDQESPELTPREFCRRMHGLAELEGVDILRAELQPGYRKRCIGLLSKVLDVKRTSVINWGTSLEFEKDAQRLPPRPLSVSGGSQRSR